MNQHFWRGKRVFLTGHTGFKGSWLSLWLQDLGAELTGFSLTPPTSPSLFETARVGTNMISLVGDIRDLPVLKEAMIAARPEIVIHMAAQPLVRLSYDDPVGTYSSNVMGVVNLLEAVRASGSVRSVVNVTTDKCYENREWAWGYRENEQMGGFDPYSSSKGCAELITAAYRSSYFHPDNYLEHGVAISTARAGNVIGGGDWAKDRLIPDIVNAFAAGDSVMIRNPNAIRPWQHVLEPLRGYLVLAERMYDAGADFSQAWNFGPNDDDAKPVAWIVERMSSLWGQQAAWSIDDRLHPHEASFLKLDISKVRNLLGWKPVLGLGHALEYIVEWSKAVATGTDARDHTLMQIRRYQDLATEGFRRDSHVKIN
ncbi:CDP-glucose 4,6-dehydratase [Neorhizobium sp. JUb45]|uniref:CDP-glucose 4,6-dehydratase n=1 Tax=Neorhizobium sp. JUb45 TaxID=2485113 RepID=UPI0010498E1C|nr:CDP-glucose 4,6-dehydratase [Neorhizobium sp. JUb45]TCR03921.1 CDP-glucose 4,6-dehydratase [Neorhizobium sp. JUb45]